MEVQENHILFEKNDLLRPYIIVIRDLFGLPNGHHHPLVREWMDSVIECREIGLDIEDRRRLLNQYARENLQS